MDTPTPAPQGEPPASNPWGPGLPPALKSGWKTTEFWVTLIGLIFAGVLFARGKEELGAFVTACLGITYPSVRAVAKKAAVVAAKGVGVMLLLFAVGCCTGHVRASAIKPTFERIRARHDLAIQQAPYDSEFKRSADLLDSELIQRALDEAASDESGG